jgi:antitoxin ParD1/3/4
MHITFAPKDEAYLKSLVDAGYYTNVTEAIRDAVRRMRDNYTQADPFVDAVMKGVRSLDAGKRVPYTADLIEQIRQEAKESAARGEPVNPDVIPQ